MRKGFFARLAVVNIRKNKQIYVSYILACLFNVAMLYMMLFINHNAGMKTIRHSGDVLMITTMGVGVIVIFSFIFLLYSNSFLMKRRQKELGLYNILGLEKKHISWVMMLENLFSALISFVGGILVGILGSKLALLLLLKLIKVPASFGFEVSVSAIRICLEVFGAIFVLILLVNIRKVYKTNPIQLLHAQNTGEKEPKAKWLMAVAGFICLFIGYYIAITTESPLSALALFFVAVVLVMAGTYLLFTAGSIVVLKVLRWNKKFYYKTKNFTAVSGMLYRTFSKAQKTMAGVMPLMQFCMYACMLLISWFGARLIVGGSMTTGELTSMFSYAMQILMSLMMVAMVFVMITMAKASAERVAEILDEQPDLHNPANPIHEVKDGAIEFDDVSFSYKGDERKLALKNVNLHIKAGQTVGILGGTGSAKSTLVQLIPRLYDTTHGTVKVGGVDVRDYDIEALRDQVAMVLQKNVLFSGTIKENLRWGDENASDEELERVCRLAQADEFIQQMPDKYDTHIEQGGSNVSGGQKQRLCIARALLKKPKILILDDSTSAVDTKTDALIRKAFAEEIPDTTKIIIAQRVSSVQDADQIVILDGGTVQAVGTHDELLAANTIYQEIYNQQNRKGGEE